MHGSLCRPWSQGAEGDRSPLDMTHWVDSFPFLRLYSHIFLCGGHFTLNKFSSVWQDSVTGILGNASFHTQVFIRTVILFSNVSSRSKCLKQLVAGFVWVVMLLEWGIFKAHCVLTFSYRKAIMLLRSMTEQWKDFQKWTSIPPFFFFFFLFTEHFLMLYPEPRRVVVLFKTKRQRFVCLFSNYCLGSVSFHARRVFLGKLTLSVTSCVHSFWHRGLPTHPLF